MSNLPFFANTAHMVKCIKQQEMGVKNEQSSLRYWLEKQSFDEKSGDLPVIEVISDISEEEKVCEKCNSEITFMKYEIANVKLRPSIRNNAHMIK